MTISRIPFRFILTALTASMACTGFVKAELPVTTEFLDAASGQVLDSRRDRLPAYYGKAGAAPSALTPAGTAWKARWYTQLVVPAKDDYHFELRGAGAGSLQIDGKELLGRPDRAFLRELATNCQELRNQRVLVASILRCIARHQLVQH